MELIVESRVGEPVRVHELQDGDAHSCYFGNIHMPPQGIVFSDDMDEVDGRASYLWNP